MNAIREHGGANLGYVKATQGDAAELAKSEVYAGRSAEYTRKHTTTALAEEAGFTTKASEFHMENHFLFRNDPEANIPPELKKSMERGAAKVAEIQSQGHAVLAFSKPRPANDSPTAADDRMMGFAVMDKKQVDKFLGMAFSGYAPAVREVLEAEIQKFDDKQKAVLVTEMTLPDDPSRAFAQNTKLLDTLKSNVSEKVAQRADVKWTLGANIGDMDVGVNLESGFEALKNGSAQTEEVTRGLKSFSAKAAVVLFAASFVVPAAGAAASLAVGGAVIAFTAEKVAASVLRMAEEQLAHADYSKLEAREQIREHVEQHFSATLDNNIQAALENIRGVEGAKQLTSQEMAEAKSTGTRGEQVAAAKQKAELLDELARYDTKGEQAVARLAANGSAGARATLAELDQLNMELGMADRQTADGRDQYAQLLETAAATANAGLGTALSAKTPQELLQTLALASRLRAEEAVVATDSPQEAVADRVMMVVEENNRAIRNGLDATVRQRQESILSADARQTLENIAAEGQLQQNLQHVFDLANSNHYGTQNVEPARAREVFILQAEELITAQMPEALKGGDESQRRQAVERIAGELWDAQAVELSPLDNNVISTLRNNIYDHSNEQAILQIEANLREAAREMGERDNYSTRLHEQAAQQAARALRDIITDESVMNEQIVMIARAMATDAEAREQVHNHARSQYQAPRSFAERAEAQMQADGAVYSDVEQAYLRTMREQHANLVRGATEQEILDLQQSRGRAGNLARDAMQDARKAVNEAELEESIKPGGDLHVVYEQTKEQLIKYYEANEQFTDNRTDRAEEMAKMMVGVKEVSAAAKASVEQTQHDLTDFMKENRVAQAEIRALERQYRLAATKQELANNMPNEARKQERDTAAEQRAQEAHEREQARQDETLQLKREALKMGVEEKKLESVNKLLGLIAKAERRLDNAETGSEAETKASSDIVFYKEKLEELKPNGRYNEQGGREDNVAQREDAARALLAAGNEQGRS